MIVDLDNLAFALGDFPATTICDVMVDRCGLGPGKLILEAGCGSGKIGLHLVVKTKASAFLVDYDQGALFGAIRNVQALEALTMSRFPVSFGRHDIRTMPFGDGVFDLVFNEGLCEHFPDPVPVIKEMARVSRDYVAVVVPNAENPLQVELAERQTEQYAGKNHWAAYEKPMTVDDLQGHMLKAGLNEVRSWRAWRDTNEEAVRDYQYRMVMATGRVLR